MYANTNTTESGQEVAIANPKLNNFLLFRQFLPLLNSDGDNIEAVNDDDAGDAVDAVDAVGESFDFSTTAQRPIGLELPTSDRILCAILFENTPISSIDTNKIFSLSNNYKRRTHTLTVKH